MLSDFKKVVKENICSGCGACSFIEPQAITINKNKHGQLIPVIQTDLSKNKLQLLDKVCPFSSSSLDRKSNAKNEKKDIVGSYIEAYAGHVIESDFRVKGSSGGFGSWIFNELLITGIVEAVIHVKETNKKDKLFEYSISKSPSEIREGASSKYYPISLDEVLKFIKESDLTFAIMAVPCFVRAIRNLQQIDKTLASKIKIVGSIYCGHLKTENYSYYIADSIKYNHGDLHKINFRLKAKDKLSSNYKTEITTSKGTFSAFRQSIKGTNWGLGLFKYKSCDFCEDVSGDLADFSVGDAWLPKYEADDLGTNLIVIRNPIIYKILTSAGDRIRLDKLSEKDLFTSQAGGYRHKREGIHVRNKLLQLKSGFKIKPHYQKETSIGLLRTILYILRVVIRNYSNIYPYARKTKIGFRLYEYGISMFSKIHGFLTKASN